MSRLLPAGRRVAAPAIPLESDVFDSTRSACAATLLDPDFRRVAGLFEASGFAATDVVRMVSEVTEAPATRETLESLHALCAGMQGASESCALQRFVLLTAALDALGRLPDLPVSDEVKRLFCEEFRFFAGPPGEHARRYVIGTASFVAMCKTASLRRFPAGQFDWEIAGIRRSDIAAVSPRRLIPTVVFAALKMRGLQPVFFSHLNWRRGNRSLREDEANRSYYRMAQALRLQPSVRGFAACSWFRSPATHRVSPHLAWLSRVFLDNGGLVVEAGPDDPEGGVFHRSLTRRRLYEAGEFRPTKGLVMWPRDAMIAWADAHPELAGGPAAFTSEC